MKKKIDFRGACLGLCASVWEKEVLRISITPPSSQSTPLWSFVCYCLRVNCEYSVVVSPMEAPVCKRLLCRGLAHTRLAVRRRSVGFGGATTG